MEESIELVTLGMVIGLKRLLCRREGSRKCQGGQTDQAVVQHPQIAINVLCACAI